MSTRSAARPFAGLPALPIDQYRGIAVALLVGMLVIAAVAPLTTTPLPPDSAVYPSFDGQPAPMPAAAVFDYLADAQRIPTDPPPRGTILREPGLTTRALRAIVGEMMTEDQGPTEQVPTPSEPHPVRDNLLAAGPDRWSSLAEFYQTSGTSWATNGMGIVESLRATVSEGAERDDHERQALYWLNTATSAEPDNGTYRYNAALLQLMLGHYQQAAALLATIDATPDHPEVRFHHALALLRLGAPDQALPLWQDLARNTTGDWAPAVAEGRADTLVALGDVAAAMPIYEQSLSDGASVAWDLYDKVLRLQLDRGPQQALQTLGTLLARFPDAARLHYDQGRLLLLLGRTGPAVNAFRAAVQRGDSDPQLHAGLAQALLAAGDAKGAQAESEKAIAATNLDPAQADLTLTYSKLDNSDPYQRSVGQAVLTANLVRARALARLGQGGQAHTFATAVEGQGAGGDAAKAAWFRYYAALIDAAGGFADDAVARLRPATPGAAEAGGPSLGARVLAWVDMLTPAQARDQAAAVVTATDGQDGVPVLPADAAMAQADFELAGKLDAVGAPAAPFYRAAAAWEAAQAATQHQPPAAGNGTPRSVQYQVAEADYLRRQGTRDPLTLARYQQASDVAPNLAGIHTNRGLAFADLGDPQRMRREFELAGRADSQDAVAAHNLGVLDLRDGPGSLLTALANLGTARQSAGPTATRWGNSFVADPQVGGYPVPVAAGDSFADRIPALATLILLLLHTLIPRRRSQGEESRDAPPGSVLARLADLLAARLPAGAGRTAVVITFIGAIAVAGLGWAWALSGNGPIAALTLLPVTMLAALVALGAQEGMQWAAVRMERRPGTIRTQLWPLGLILSLVGAPFGVLYGRLLTTHAAGAAGSHTVLEAHRDGHEEPEELEPVAAAPAAVPQRAATRRGGTATARPPAATKTEPVAAPAPERVVWRGWGALGPAARVALLGLLANIVLTVVCGLLAAWLPNAFWRILLLANVAVLAFTAASDPGAEGWHLWRRSPLLWLPIFTVAAAALTALLLGAI
jgi:tetratricopeptide (TPR) repeat protein